MADFYIHKEEEKPFHSNPFFSQEKAYKMAISVVLYGYAEGKGTHVSVYVYLMRGPFDDILNWPFTGSVQIELLNQLDDKHHLLITTTLPECNETVCGRRATDQEKPKLGWGLPQFVAIHQLSYKPEQNRQYLKDSCLFFRISVILSGHKDWLQCS